MQGDCFVFPVKTLKGFLLDEYVNPVVRRVCYCLRQQLCRYDLEYWLLKHNGFNVSNYIQVHEQHKNMIKMTFWPSSAKRKRSGLGSMVRLRFASSAPLPSRSTRSSSNRQKSFATSSRRGRNLLTAALIITSLLSWRRSDLHSSPFLWREQSYVCLFILKDSLSYLSELKGIFIVEQKLSFSGRELV